MVHHKWPKVNRLVSQKVDFTTIDDFQSWNSPNAGRADMNTATTLQSFTINKTGTYIAVGSIYYESYDHPLELNVVLSHNGVSTNVGRNYRNPSGKVDIYLTLDVTGIFQATEGDTISLIANPTNGAIGYYRQPETVFFKIARVC